ncbi:MAG TPA: alpha/beta hydrolase [Anaerolineaceae bacterium]|nr:alpha/beta hydrolase [Anaerolineaceae bacterium]
MNIIHSQDNTPIAYEITGSGPLLIIVTGALNTHNFGVPGEMVPFLQEHFTVLTYDRRGRGQSGDIPPYSIEKEIQDLAALIDHNGGKAYLYGHSAGAALALFTAAQFPGKVLKVAAYEPPLGGGWLERTMTNLLIRQIGKQVAKGENLAVVKRFMRFVGMDEQLIKDTLASEHGQTIIDMAGTIVYEAEIQKASKAFLQNQAANLPMPVLMLAGTISFKTAAAIMTTFTQVIPRAESQILEGQTHSVEPAIISPILQEFFLRS